MLPAAGLHVPGMASPVLCLLSADPSGQAARSLRTCKQCWATHSGSVTLILDSIRGRAERSIPACFALLLGIGIGWAVRSFVTLAWSLQIFNLLVHDGGDGRPAGRGQ